MKTEKQYKDLTIREFTKAADIYESSHAGIYEMCKDDYPYISGELAKEDYTDLLDCGCGTGPMISLLYEEDPTRHYTGIDITPRMIEVARAKNLSGVEWVVGDCEDLPFDENAFDAIICSNSFHHYPNPQKFFDSVKRVLRPSEETLREMADSNISDFYFDYTPIYKTSKRQKNPDQLHFDFHLSNVGQSIKDDKSAMRETIEIERRLQSEFDQSPAQIRRIITSLTPDDREPFLRKMDELKELIESKKVQIKDSKRSYCNRTFTDFLHTRIDDKKRIMEEQIAQSRAAHQQTAQPTSGESVVSESTESVYRLYTDEDHQLFLQTKESLSDVQGIENWLPEIELYKVEPDIVTIVVPTRAFHETFTHYFGSVLLDRIEERFHREVGVYFLNS